MEYSEVILLVFSLVGSTIAATGSTNTLGSELVSWCWTSTGYDDYRSCSATLLDNSRNTFVDLSSMTSEPSPTWLTLTFYSFTDVTGTEIIYTGDPDLVFTFIFSDGTSEVAADHRSSLAADGREYLVANAYFSRRTSRSLTVNIQGKRNTYRALIHDISLIGNKHVNLERISDWEHRAKCRQLGRDCDRLVNGFVDREYKLAVGQSAIIYLNSTYPISHLTLLEAVPEFGDSIYDRMAVTLGNPTGYGFHTETYEFSLCKQEWSKYGPVWQQITLPEPTTAIYVNITILGEEEKIVNGLYEVEVYRSRDGSRYRAQDQPCVTVKQVELDGCAVSCDCEKPDKIPTKTDNRDFIEETPVVGESDALIDGMSDNSKLLFALCGTMGLAVGCLVGWVVTCVVLCRMRRHSSLRSDLSQPGSQKNLTKWEERGSVSSSEASTPEGSLKRQLRQEEWVDQREIEHGQEVKVVPS